MPSKIDCARVTRTKSDAFTTTSDAGHALLVGAFPMPAGANRGHLIILHDLSFVSERASRARLYATIALLGVILGIGLLATAVVLGFLRVWSRLVRLAVTDTAQVAIASIDRKSAFYFLLFSYLNMSMNFYSPGRNCGE